MSKFVGTLASCLDSGRPVGLVESPIDLRTLADLEDDPSLSSLTSDLFRTVLVPGAKVGLLTSGALDFFTPFAELCRWSSDGKSGALSLWGVVFGLTTP